MNALVNEFINCDVCLRKSDRILHQRHLPLQSFFEDCLQLLRVLFSLLLGPIVVLHGSARLWQVDDRGSRGAFTRVRDDGILELAIANSDSSYGEPLCFLSFSIFVDQVVVGVLLERWLDCDRSQFTTS